MRIDWRQTALVALLGFVGGFAYRYGFDIAEEASLLNYLRSGLHGAGLALVGWMAHLSFVVWPGGRLPLLAALVVKSVLMTAALAAAAVALQLVLYGGIERHWLIDTLPAIVV